MDWLSEMDWFIPMGIIFAAGFIGCLILKLIENHLRKKEGPDVPVRREVSRTDLQLARRIYYDDGTSETYVRGSSGRFEKYVPETFDNNLNVLEEIHHLDELDAKSNDIVTDDKMASKLSQEADKDLDLILNHLDKRLSSDDIPLEEEFPNSKLNPITEEVNVPDPGTISDGSDQNYETCNDDSVQTA